MHAALMMHVYWKAKCEACIKLCILTSLVSHTGPNCVYNIYSTPAVKISVMWARRYRWLDVTQWWVLDQWHLADEGLLQYLQFIYEYLHIKEHSGADFEQRPHREVLPLPLSTSKHLGFIFETMPPKGAEQPKKRRNIKITHFWPLIGHGNWPFKVVHTNMHKT